MEDLIKNLEKEIKSKFEEIERIGEKNFIKVLNSFRKNGVVESDFLIQQGMVLMM